MCGDAKRLKWKLEEMLASGDPEWVNAVVVTLNAMYRQFALERQRNKQIVPLDTGGTPQRQIGLICKRRFTRQTRTERHRVGVYSSHFLTFF
jgi:hypothetical protein